MNVRTLLIAALLSFALPAGASAKLRPYIPPGNSGANQYLESVPTAGGNNATGNVIQSGDRGSSLAPSTQSALTHAGADGRATAAVARETAPKRHRHGRHAAGGAGGSTSQSGRGAGGGTSQPGGGGAASDSGASPVGTVVRSLFGLQGPGGGVALPAILIATALALGAGRAWRRRTS